MISFPEAAQRPLQELTKDWYSTNNKEPTNFYPLNFQDSRKGKEKSQRQIVEDSTSSKQSSKNPSRNSP